MLGAIIGDIAGSRFEFRNYRKKDFEIFHPDCFFTDDTVMSLAIANAILACDGDYGYLKSETIKNMVEIGSQYPNCGYGMRFFNWIFDEPIPYESYGNGSAMRVSAVAYIANSIEEVKEYSKIVTEVSHNHPEGIKGAEATAVAIYMALHGSHITDIKNYITENYYPLNFTIDEIRDTYEFNETCQDTVPQALEAFFESHSFEDAIRTAVSVGGDSDTLAAITGSIAEAYYGIPNAMRIKAFSYLDTRLAQILNTFEFRYPSK